MSQQPLTVTAGNKRPWPWMDSKKRRLKFWTNVCLVIAIGIGISLAVAHGGNVTSSIAWSAAALGAGSLFGFLFGIPGVSAKRIVIDQRVVSASDTAKDPAPVPAAPQPAAVSPPSDTPDKPTPDPASAPGNGPLSNESNLVQVSDWVTKLLLGGGLTQLQQIPRKIWELAAWVAIGIDPGLTAQGKEASLQSNQSFAAGLLIYFSILGFFAGYFLTQLQFGKRLRF